MDNVEDRHLPLGVNFTLPSDENMTTNLKPGGKMVIKESIKNQIEKFKERVISFAELYERYQQENIALINEITSKNDWSQLNIEAQEDRKGTALASVKLEQDQTLRNRQAKLEEDIDTYERKLTADLFGKLAGLDNLKDLADAMGISYDLANLLIEDLSKLRTPTEILSENDSYNDLLLRKVVRDGSKGMSDLQRNYALERINSEGSEDMQTYK